MKKNILIVIMIFALFAFMVFSGCAGRNDNQEEPPAQEDVENTDDTNGDEEQAPEEDIQNEADNDANEDENAESDQNEKMSVEYSGQIDNNSIEVKSNGDFMAVRLSEEVKEYFNSESEDYKNFQEGDQISITYTTNEHDQIIAIDINKIES